MALIVVSGQPSSGKSTASARLKELLESRCLGVCIVAEPSLQLVRNESYKDSVSEKITRGRLKSAAERQTNRKTIVILDSLNNIKGYRYELWCIARAAAARYCVLQCCVPEDTAKAWNAARPAEQGYSEEVFRDLWGRYEEPDSRNRWDKPLFRLDPRNAEESATILQGLVESIMGSGQSQPGTVVAKQLQPTMATSNPALSTTNLLHELDAAAQHVIRNGGSHISQHMNVQGLVESITGNGQPQPGTVVAKQLQPTMATSNPALSTTNLLHELDAAAQEVIGKVAAAQELAGSSAAGRIDLGPGIEPLVLDRHVNLAELRRHKRVFLKVATQNPSARVSSQAGCKMFASFLQENLQ